MKIQHQENIDVTVTLKIEACDIPIRGNAIASGDDAYDKTIEDDLMYRLENGDIWAWFNATAIVEISVNGVKFQGLEFLGACSYKDLKQFLEDGDYGRDLIDCAWERAIVSIEEYVSAVHGTIETIAKPENLYVNPIVFHRAS